MFPRSRPWTYASAAVLALTAAAAAQEPGAAEFDLALEVADDVVLLGETLDVDAGLVARAGGVEGWSFGVRHDSAVLALESVTSDGTDLPRFLRSPAFELTRAVEGPGGEPRGFVQAVVLSFERPVSLPPAPFHRLAVATYAARDDACGQNGAGEIRTELSFAGDLRVPGSPDVDVVLGVRGRSVRPEVLRGATVTLRCARAVPELRLLLESAGAASLRADRSATLDLEVRLANPRGGPRVELQAWSYSLELDTALLDPVLGLGGADARTLRGGRGPEYVQYNLDDVGRDGTSRGVTVGTVIDLSAPGTNVLGIADGGTVHLDSLRIRSAIELPVGAASRQTTVRFADLAFGANQPIEILVVVDGTGIVPDFTDDVVVTLLALEPESSPFIRGDANNDARVNIADGVWVINRMFRAGPEISCPAAADANNNSRVELGDAIFIFQYQLQLGATAQNPFPAPAAPFPACGRVEGLASELCPPGSSVCSG